MPVRVCVMGTQLRHQRTHRSVQLDLHPTRPSEVVHSETQGDTLSHARTANQSPPLVLEYLHQSHTDPMLTSPHSPISPIHNAAVTHRNKTDRSLQRASHAYTQTPLLHLSAHPSSQNTPECATPTPTPNSELPGYNSYTQTHVITTGYIIPPPPPRMRGSNTGRTRLSWEKPSVQPLLSAPKHHSQLSVPEHTHTDIHTHHSCTHASSTHLKQRQKTLASRDWYKHYRERERSHMTHMSHGSQ